MPEFSYNCRRCGEEFTTLVRRPEDKQAVSCPHCGGQDLQQLYRRFNYVKIAQKYNPQCGCASNCTSATKFGCGKYAPQSPSSELNDL